MQVAVVMNAGAGALGQDRCADREAEIRAAFEEVGIAATLVLCAPGQVPEAARQAAASGVDAVVAAGGDGTGGAVARGLAGGDVPLAVLPLGTLNHFARDLGMPTDVRGAVRAIAAGQLGRIDLGDLNGRTFINNSSIGLYPEMVIQREREQRRRGRRKWVAMLIAAARVLRRFPLLRVRIGTNHAAFRAKTPFVFIGNNAYAINVLELGRRPRLDRGDLSLYMIRSTTRLGMFWRMVRAILQRLDAVEDFEAHRVREAIVDTGRRVLRVALDGEVVRMAPPLVYRSRPRALAVLLPPGATVVKPAPSAAEAEVTVTPVATAG